METKLTFEQFQKEMIDYARSVCQSDNYPGDAYYLEDDGSSWRDHFNDGDTPEEAVDSDMEYWE